MINIIKPLKWRYAVKKFDIVKKVSKEDIQEIIDAFILTPSSFNLQPWKLFYVEDIEKRKSIASFCWNNSQILDSTGIFILAKKLDISNNLVNDLINYIVKKGGITKENLQDYEDMMKNFLTNMNEKEKQIWAEKQVMIALGNMLNICAMKYIDSCPIEGFQKDKVDELFGLKEKGFTSVVLLPIGYRDENDASLKKGKIRYDENKVFEKI